MLSRNALILLEKRYLIRDENNKIIETPDALFKRVAHAIALAEEKYASKDRLKFWESEFYLLLKNLDFLPNSPTLMNAGRENGQLSACFVLPMEDSISSIFEGIKNAALIQQSGGGTGFDFSALRPEGDFIRKTGGHSSGPLSFMKIINSTTHYIKQGGKRRGANMGILAIDHPDILKFIKAKREADSLTNFNLSIAISDRFMDCLQKKESWPLIHPNTKKIHSTLDATFLWNEIISSAWKSGDPGLLFIDEINRHNPTPDIELIKACNPCGEVPLLDWEACNLGSINLHNMLKKMGKKYYIDWNKLRKTIALAVRFLDNVIEVNYYLLPQIDKKSKANRKIGLGVMGWADLLVRLKIPYNTERAVKLGEKIMHFIAEESFTASKKLAKERGVFPNWEKSIYYPDSPLRNATRTSIAPTGSISILANISSSIEPLFALAFERKHILDGERLFEFHPVLLECIEKKKILNLKDPDQFKKEDIEGILNKLPKELKSSLISSHEISWDFHLKHQITFQKYTDNAVSKTINFPESASIEDIGNAYRQAWKLKAKGITVYRYNSRRSQVLNLKKRASTLPVVMHGGESICKVCIE